MRSSRNAARTARRSSVRYSRACETLEIHSLEHGLALGGHDRLERHSAAADQPGEVLLEEDVRAPGGGADGVELVESRHDVVEEEVEVDVVLAQDLRHQQLALPARLLGQQRRVDVEPFRERLERLGHRPHRREGAAIVGVRARP